MTQYELPAVDARHSQYPLFIGPGLVGIQGFNPKLKKIYDFVERGDGVPHRTLKLRMDRFGPNPTRHQEPLKTELFHIHQETLP